MKNCFIIILFLCTSFFFPIASKDASDKKFLENELLKLAPAFFPDGPLSIKPFVEEDDIAESGQESTSIFFVSDAKKEPIGVLKIVSEEEKFDRECNALLYAKNLPLNHFHMVHLEGMGEIGLENGERVYVIGERIAKGYSLNHYLKELSRVKNIEMRKELFHTLERALIETAHALGEVHTLSGSSSKGLVHGDPHPGNIFYDAGGNQITFIDFSEMAKEKPVVTDVAHFLVTFEIISSYYHLSDAEIGSLTTLFLTSYQETGAVLSKEDLDFFIDDLWRYYGETSPLPIHSNESPKELLFLHHFAKAKLTSSTAIKKN